MICPVCGERMEIDYQKYECENWFYVMYSCDNCIVSACRHFRE